MKKYPETLEEDRTLIAEDDQNNSLTRNQRNCILYRMGEKKILKYLISFAGTIQTILKSENKDAIELAINKFDELADCH